MKVTEDNIVKAAKLLSCGPRWVKHYVKKYGRLDLNELSISIHGVPYVPKPQEPREQYCPRCHWPVERCACSEYYRKRNREKEKVIWESKKY